MHVLHPDVATICVFENLDNVTQRCRFVQRQSTGIEPLVQVGFAQAEPLKGQLFRGRSLCSQRIEIGGKMPDVAIMIDQHIDFTLLCMSNMGFAESCGRSGLAGFGKSRSPGGNAFRGSTVRGRAKTQIEALKELLPIRGNRCRSIRPLLIQIVDVFAVPGVDGQFGPFSGHEEWFLQ